MRDVFARPWRSILQSRLYRLVDVWGTEATEGTTPIIARTPSAGAFSADGKRLLLGMNGDWEKRERVKLFSIDGVEIAGYETHPGEGGVMSVGFSSDESFVVAALHKKLVRWTVGGQRVGEYPVAGDAIGRVVSADGAVGAVSHPYAGADSAIELVDLVTMQVIARVPAPPGHDRVALARDARAVFAADEHAVHCIPVDAGGARWRTATHGGTRGLVVSEDGAFVVACHAPLSHQGREVVVYRVEDGEVVRRFPSTIANGARLLLDGRLLVWPQGGGGGEIIDLARDLPPRSAPWVADVVAVSRDGETLARGTFQYDIALVHDTRDGRLRVGPPRVRYLNALSVSPDGTRVAAMSAQPGLGLALRDATMGDVVATVPNAELPLAWHQDGSCLAHASRIPSERSHLVATSRDGVRLASVAIDYPVGNVTMPPRPDGRFLVMAGTEIELRPIRELGPPEPVVATPPNAVPNSSGLSVSPSGRRCLFGNGIGENRLIDLETKKTLLTLPMKREALRYTALFRMLDDATAVFAPPGRLIALDLETETPRWEVAVQASSVLVDASRGRMIVLTGTGLLVLSPASGEELDRLDFGSSGDEIGAAAFGPDGRLYCGSTLGRIYVFEPGKP